MKRQKKILPQRRYVLITGFTTPVTTVHIMRLCTALAHKGIKRDKIDHGQVQTDFSGELCFLKFSCFFVVKNLCKFAAENFATNAHEL
ncbi:MAG: hypothetical protein BWK80_50270 [Desulfobacteraceae bacterium IS3]|nr:MAG: hypothetical protein BWK80_50270 [Desulfobacteraceae bacterium IS3]